MKQNLFFSCFFIMGILISFHIVGCMNNKMSPPDIAINRVILHTVKEINNFNIGYHLDLAGTGGSIDHDTGKEKMIGIAFQLDHPLNKEMCRWLIVTIAQKFLENINSDQELIPFLSNGRFFYINIEVNIELLSTDSSTLYYPDIGFVSLRGSKISYAYNDPKDINGGYSPYKEVVHEPFEEALKIVETQGRPNELKGDSSLESH